MDNGMECVVFCFFLLYLIFQLFYVNHTLIMQFLKTYVKIHLGQYMDGLTYRTKKSGSVFKIKF